MFFHHDWQYSVLVVLLFGWGQNLYLLNAGTRLKMQGRPVKLQILTAVYLAITKESAVTALIGRLLSCVVSAVVAYSCIGFNE